MFATLDPTMRAIKLPGGRTAILSDTVGFVSDLPHELVAAFRATLEEVLEADVVVHVRDISHPDTESQKADVEAVLAEMGLERLVEEEGLVEVLNKIDLMDRETRTEVEAIAARRPRAVAASAITGEGTEAVLKLVEETFGAGQEVLRLAVPLTDGATIAWLYRKGSVVERRDDEAKAHMLVRLDPADAARLDERLKR